MGILGVMQFFFRVVAKRKCKMRESAGGGDDCAVVKCAKEENFSMRLSVINVKHFSKVAIKFECVRKVWLMLDKMS